MIELTPTQVRGLKLAKDGDLFPQAGNKWTHLNAEVTYLKRDRFRERPQAIKTVTTATLQQLRGFGFVESTGSGSQLDDSAHAITMAGKIWLLTNK
jgi:hypothetical protein